MAIDRSKTHRAKLGVGYVDYDRLAYYLDQDRPDVSKLERVRKTINLTNKDDSLLAVAHHIYKIIRLYHPDRHVVRIEILDWTAPVDRKIKFLSDMFEHYDPLWYARVEVPASSKDKNGNYQGTSPTGDLRTVVVCTFPGIDYLINW